MEHGARYTTLARRISPSQTSFNMKSGVLESQTHRLSLTHYRLLHKHKTRASNDCFPEPHQAIYVVAQGRIPDARLSNPPASTVD